MVPLALSVLLVVPPFSVADKRCSADLVCVEIEKGGGSVSLVLEALSTKPLTFGLFFSSNLAEHNPPLVRLDRPGRMALVSVPNPGGPWGFDFRIHYGHERHKHDDAYIYTLPFAVGAAYRVTQSHTALTTHRLGNRYALDWDMPVGEPVHAARGGTVVSTYDGATERSLTGAATANHIWIRHADGTIGKYLHLDHHGVSVAEGQEVAAGERIGRSGETGFANGPHLHFSVSTLTGERREGDAVYETFDVRFATVDGPRRLVTGDAYARPPDHGSGSPEEN